MRMTHAMWLFEAEAIRERDRLDGERAKAYVTAGASILRETLIRLLGLNQGLPVPTPTPTPADGAAGADASAPPPPTPYTPLVYLLARPEVSKALMDSAKTEEKVAEAVTSQDFDQLSQALAEGDMTPFTEAFEQMDAAVKNAELDELQALLARLGVVQEDRGDAPIAVSAASGDGRGVIHG